MIMQTSRDAASMIELEAYRAHEGTLSGLLESRSGDRL